MCVRECVTDVMFANGVRLRENTREDRDVIILDYDASTY